MRRVTRADIRPRRRTILDVSNGGLTKTEKSFVSKSAAVLLSKESVILVVSFDTTTVTSCCTLTVSPVLLLRLLLIELPTPYFGIVQCLQPQKLPSLTFGFDAEASK